MASLSLGVRLGRPEGSATAHGGHSLWDQLSELEKGPETLVVSSRKRSPREGVDPTLILPPAAKKSSCLPCPSCWMPCRARGCPPGRNPAPLGPRCGAGAPRLPRCLAAHVDSLPLPPPHRPLSSLRTINSGLSFLTFPGMLSPVPGVHPQKRGMAFGSTGMWGGLLQSPSPPTPLSPEPWSRPV